MIYFIPLLKLEKKKIINNEYENDYFNFSEIVLNHYVGRKNDKEILR